MLAFHGEGRYVATVGCYDYVHTIPYGVLDLDADRVVRMLEKPTEAWSVNAGIYVLEPSLLRRVPEGIDFPLPALVEECLDRGEPVGAYHIAGDWIDVGHRDELLRARGGKERS
jgi:NDP-sugar pyrophosphorylase family protein